jgi:transcription elongation factor Elf1
MDALSELQTIVQTSGFSRAKLAAILREMLPKETEKRPHRKHEPSSPVKQFTTVKRNYTCLHCGRKFASILNLMKEDEVAAITAGGKVVIINSDSPAEISCVTTWCEECKDYIKKLSREELEENYMILLQQVSFTRYTSPYGNKITIATEVKL